jgi:hypothetical protein
MSILRSYRRNATDELIDEYVRNAIASDEALRDCDPGRANRSHDKVLRALKLLTERGERMRLIDLLDHKNVSVRYCAATHLLPFCEDRARETLREVVEEGSWPTGFNASIVLQEWDKGTLKVP